MTSKSKRFAHLTVPFVHDARASRARTSTSGLEADPAAAAALSSPSAPSGMDPALCVRAQTLVLPTIRKSGVVALAAVRASLERSGSADLAALALLREPELLGALGGNVASVDGACALVSLGDPTLDPFRGFLLKLLRTRGRTVRRTDVMEGAAAALGAAPSQSVYMRCLGDLCVSRGSTWVMKSGEPK